MYRQLLLVTFCFHATSTAPQDDRKSEITYFKIEPVIKSNDDINKEQIITESPPLIANKTGILSHSDIPEIKILSEPITEEINVTNTEKRSAYVDDSRDASGKNNNLSDANGGVDRSEKTEETQSDDNVPSETKPERESRDFEEQTTSNYETENSSPTEKPEEIIEDTKTSPKFTPKLSYFKKFGGSSYNKNFIENQGKRRFRSRCRCEKIWNCPKLQISVPRCPEEQFMCCF